MITIDTPQTPEATFVTAIIMQAYRDLFITIKSDGSSSFTTQADQDAAMSFLTDSSGTLARHRNDLCSLIGWDGNVLAARIRDMMDGAEFPPPVPDPSPATIARHADAVERIRARWKDLNLPRNSPKRPVSSVGHLLAAE
ncbi:hypothetical protein [Phaeobacter sp. NW0010-22]|uniref:hypothetical protein n=1 Tax=Phaeobacter sp. NW0010-22 TaxID=3135907 RepID=UPI00310BEAEE